MLRQDMRAIIDGALALVTDSEQKMKMFSTIELYVLGQVRGGAVALLSHHESTDNLATYPLAFLVIGRDDVGRSGRVQARGSVIGGFERTP